MLALGNMAGGLSDLEARIWGETVRASESKLKVLAVSGSKDGFTNQRAPDGTPWAPLAHPRPNGGTKVLRDRGLLAASMSASVTEGQLRLQASGPQANLQQFGGTVRPKKGKFLAIPLTREAKRAGSPRGNFPRPLFVIQAVGANAYLAEQTGKGKRQKIVFQYILVKEVKVPARRFIGFSNDTQVKIGILLSNEYVKRLAEGMESARQAEYAANPLIT